MLKIIIIVLFLLPLCLINYLYWMVQRILFLLSFIFIIINMYTNYYIRISYIFGCDIISYGLILLRIWIISLIFIASELIYKNNNYIILNSIKLSYLYPNSP